MFLELNLLEENKFLSNLKITKVYRSEGARILAKFFRESTSKMCFSIPGINFRCRYISFSGHLADAAMKARSRWCFLPPSVSVDCQYLGKTARDDGIEQVGFLVPIRVSAHLLTCFDDRNLSRYKTVDWEKRCVARRRESRIYREVFLNNIARTKIFMMTCAIDHMTHRYGLVIFSLTFNCFLAVSKTRDRLSISGSYDNRLTIVILLLQQWPSIRQKLSHSKKNIVMTTIQVL